MVSIKVMHNYTYTLIYNTCTPVAFAQLIKLSVQIHLNFCCVTIICSKHPKPPNFNAHNSYLL